MFDMFSLPMLAMAGASNPDLFAKAMAAAGISPSQASGVPGISMGEAPANMTPGSSTGLGALLAGPAVETSNRTGVLSAPSPTATPAQPMNPMLEALQAVKTPQAPAPIMNAGVSGSQKAPDMAVKMGGASMSANPMLQALLALGSHSAAPGLGALLKGV